MSSQLLAYTFSKFLGGLAADVFSSRLLFCGGLFLSGLIVLLFTCKLTPDFLCPLFKFKFSVLFMVELLFYQA